MVCFSFRVRMNGENVVAFMAKNLNVIVSGSFAVRLLTNNPNIIPNDIDCVILGMDSDIFKVKYAPQICSQFGLDFKDWSFFYHDKKIIDLNFIPRLKNNIDKELDTTLVIKSLRVYNASKLLRIYTANFRTQDQPKIVALRQILSQEQILHDSDSAGNLLDSEGVVRNLFADDSDDDN